MERLDPDGTIVVTLEKVAVPRQAAAKRLLTARLPRPAKPKPRRLPKKFRG